MSFLLGLLLVQISITLVAGALLLLSSLHATRAEAFAAHTQPLPPARSETRSRRIWTGVTGLLLFGVAIGESVLLVRFIDS